MFSRFSKIMLVAAALAALLGSSSAVADDVTVRQAWSRATPKGAKVAGGYLTIENRKSGGAICSYVYHKFGPADRAVRRGSLHMYFT